VESPFSAVRVRLRADVYEGKRFKDGVALRLRYEVSTRAGKRTLAFGVRDGAGWANLLSNAVHNSRSASAALGALGRDTSSAQFPAPSRISVPATSVNRVVRRNGSVPRWSRHSRREIVSQLETCCFRDW
jgi:hypothetical protein